jgi:hypothetical protein
VGADCSILGSLEDPTLPGNKAPVIKQRFQVRPLSIWALLAGASISLCTVEMLKLQQ